MLWVEHRGEAVAPALIDDAVHIWDFSTVASPDVGDAVTTVTDTIASVVMTTTGVVTLGRQLGGGSSLLPGVRGVVLSSRMTTITSPTPTPMAQPFGVTWIGKVVPDVSPVWFDLDDAAPRPHSFSDTNWKINAGTTVTSSAVDRLVHTFYAEFDGASSKLYIDGALATTGDAGTATTSNTQALFNLWAGSLGGDITIGELGLISGAHTAGEVAAEHTRLWDKWVGGPSGGVITVSGGYTYHTFTSSGDVFVPGPTPIAVDYLVVAGGGGGGNVIGGGGGGGGVATGSTTISTNQAVTIGGGGSGGFGNPGTIGTAGSNSSLGATATATGGGRGAGSGAVAAGGNGGSGGGGSFNSATTIVGGTGTAGQGSNGGNSVVSGIAGGGGGGGGSAAGTNGTGGTGGAGGPGGAGTEWPAASGVRYGGGGGGGRYVDAAGPAGLGGSGGGGNGGTRRSTGLATSGTVNTGGGGGGGGHNDGTPAGSSTGGAGGSGIVIVRYLTPP
jgi:hypothetical protein